VTADASPAAAVLPSPFTDWNFRKAMLEGVY
jgi:hypothetical protein